MDPVNRSSSVTPNKSRLARTFAKVLHIRAVTGVKNQKNQSNEKVKHGEFVNDGHNLQAKFFDEEEEEKLQKRASMEVFLAKLFASISSVKAGYAQLQFSQTPYNPEGIQTSDQMIVTELKTLSELKQSFFKKHLDDPSPETTLQLAEIQEQKSLVKLFEITGKKLESEVRLKNSEITFLREKLEEANNENKLLDRRLNSSGSSSPLENIQSSSLGPTHFIATLRMSIKYIRNFVRLMISEMESGGWDLDAAANSIEPNVIYWNTTQKCFAFESFVCREIFDGFNYPNFSIQSESSSSKRSFFDRFMELKSLKPKEYIGWKPKSIFAKFCQEKYLKLVHPKMETFLFGNLNQRNLVNGGEFPETAFFSTFAEMAKRVWLLHCLAFSFEPQVSIFQVKKGSRFSEVFMESVNEEAFLPSDGKLETDPSVAFTVVPGFKIGKSVIQSQVYLGKSQDRPVEKIRMWGPNTGPTIIKD